MNPSINQYLTKKSIAMSPFLVYSPSYLSILFYSGDAQDVRRGSGLAAVFLARDRFAVLDKTRQLLVS
jgi:hypothetical protein